MRLNPRSFRARLVVTLALAIASFPGLASGQTTQPATDAAPRGSATRDWPHAVQALATALAGDDLAAVQRMLEPAPQIRGFASEKLQTPDRLMGATTGSKVLGAHAYPATPRTLASDLADDFTSAGDAVPEQVRQQMIPPDDAAAERANETAARWIESVLRTKETDRHPTAVIVLWPAERKSRVEGPVRRATFVIVRGEKLLEPQGERFVFRRIVFGDPLEAPPR